MKNSRVVITGGAGFIGSNLAYELSDDNDIVIIDDLSTGSIDNVAGLVGKNNVTLIKGSILDLRLLETSLKRTEYVFHLAAIASVPRSIVDPLPTNEVNITGTLNVLTAAKKNGIKKVIYASSSSVYGDTPTLPKTEDMQPNSQSPYALTKLVGEYYCRIFYEVYDIPTICLRYFNVYGPRQNPDSEYAAVIPSFISRVSRNEQPIIYGDGSQTRDFTYVRDVVRANIIAAKSDATGVYNIGSGGNVTINELAELISYILNRDVKPIYEKPRAGDVLHSLADITLARTVGYEPQYSLVDGLRETINGVIDAS
ncbi:MAG TPA: SDR family oxidoreductase [Dehalococcoidia bacterium]|nr:SDR family oxidoreductase [Dehalococcoidia bacterium]